MSLRKTAKGIFLDTLAHLGIEEVMRTRVRHQGETLHIGDSAYDLRDFDRVVVVSIGKAAATMWDALRPQLEPALQRSQTIEAIVVGATMPREEDRTGSIFSGQPSLSKPDLPRRGGRRSDAACLLRRSLPGAFSDQRWGVGNDREAS